MWGKLLSFRRFSVFLSRAGVVGNSRFVIPMKSIPYPQTSASQADSEQLYEAARAAVRQGKPQEAYQLSLQATQVTPQNTEAWLLRAETAASPEETLICLNQVHELSPHHPFAWEKTYHALRLLMQQNPFLAYLDETEHLYYVKNGGFLALTIPKKRARQRQYLIEREKPLQAAAFWLVLSIFGLLLAGITTLIFAPLSFMAVLWANRKPLPRGEQIKSVIIMGIAGLTALVGIFLSLLFWLHLRG